MEPAAINPHRRAQLLAQLYDWEHDQFGDDVDLYLALARRSDGPVLEPACGTGRALAPIAAHGIHVVGIDNSRAMLERARSRLQHAPAGADLRLQDIRDPLPRGPFALIFFALSGFGFARATAQEVALLRSVAQRLGPEGVLALDLVHCRALSDNPEGIPILQNHGEDGEIGAYVTKWIVQHVHASDESVELVSFYDIEWPNGQLTRIHDISRFRYHSRFEIELLLNEAGLAVEGVYGTYELAPFDDESQRMIVLARPHARQRKIQSKAEQSEVGETHRG